MGGNVVHHVLECGRGITQAKVHDHGLIEAIFCFECCLVLICIFDLHLIEAFFYVELSEDKGVLHFCN